MLPRNATHKLTPGVWLQTFGQEVEYLREQSIGSGRRAGLAYGLVRHLTNKNRNKSPGG